MKKIISVISSLCFVFLIVCFANPTIKNTLDSYDELVFYMYDSSELAHELESKGVDIENAEEYDVCVLIKAKEDTSNNSLFDVFNIYANDKIDEELIDHRKKVKSFYSTFNENIVSTLGIERYNYYISFYSPYIEIVFDNITEYAESLSAIIDSIVYNQEMVSSVSSYATYDIVKDEATVDDESYSTNYLLGKAFDDIGVSTSQYTGNGINVGILDNGVPENTENLIMGKYTMLTETTNLHSAVIASIIGGTSGIAENVNFYCMKVGDSIINDCNLLINSCNVNIINMSFARASLGYYSYFDSCIDNIISNTGCTIVISAGNEGLGNKYVTTPGCSMNAITVGSINNSQNLSADSSWMTSNIYLFKPDVVAPGGRLWNIPNISNINNGIEGYSGTSYAAPMVVGTIALLMEEFPVLKINPALVKSVLHMGAEKLPSQTNYFDQKSGFGLINYQNMRNCLLNSNYSNFTISTEALEGDTVSSCNVTIPYLDQILINANSIINSSNRIESPLQADLVFTNYSLKIYDLGMSKYVATSNINSGVDYLLFTNGNSNNSSFRIDIVLETDSVSNEDEFGAIAYEFIPHAHSYTQNYESSSTTQHKAYCECGEYVFQNHVIQNNECIACGEPHTTHDYSDHFVHEDSTTHKSYCICGGYIISGHVVSNEEYISGKRYATCLACGGMASLGMIHHQGIGALPRTENGSFILPDGIIVLVDEDIEAYLVGTLEFIYPDENLETE